MAHTSPTDDLEPLDLTRLDPTHTPGTPDVPDPLLASSDGHVPRGTGAAPLRIFAAEPQPLTFENSGAPLTIRAVQVCLDQLRADINVLSERARRLAGAADRVDLAHHGSEGEHLAVELVDEIAAIVRCLRDSDQPARDAVHRTWILSLPALRSEMQS